MLLDTTWIQFIQTHTSHFLSSKCLLILSSHLHTGNPSDLSFRFSEQHCIRIPGLPHLCQMPRPAPPPRRPQAAWSDTNQDCYPLDCITVQWFKPLLRYCIWKTRRTRLKMCMRIEILSAIPHNLSRSQWEKPTDLRIPLFWDYTQHHRLYQCSEPTYLRHLQRAKFPLFEHSGPWRWRHNVGWKRWKKNTLGRSDVTKNNEILSYTASVASKIAQLWLNWYSHTPW